MSALGCMYFPLLAVKDTAEKLCRISVF